MAKNFWHIRNCSLFHRLSDSQLAFLEQHARTKAFPKGSTVYLPHETADGTCLLAEGRIRIGSTTPDGKQCILGFVEPGEIFGELSIVESGQREERAEAVAKATVILIPSQEIRRVMEESPQLSIGVTKLIGLRRKRIERRLRSLLFRNNRDRLTHLLLELAETYGQATSEGIGLKIRLSHQDLASIIGATRETVTTVLGEMQTEGLLTIQRQKLIIHDLPKLAGREAKSTSPASKQSDAESKSELGWQPPLPIHDS